jgi:DNA-directed RNA polymerase specialized sigma24 family protein
MRTQKKCGNVSPMQGDWSSTHVAAMLTIGRQGARSAGVEGEDAEDCAAAFVAHLWQKRARIAATQIPVEKEGAFLRRCAYRFAISWARTMRNHPVIVTDDMRVLDSTVPNLCQQTVFQREFYTIIGERIGRMAVQQQTLFMRCYVGEEERTVVARELNSSESAIRKAAQRARGHLQTLLQQSGWGENNLREYLA